MRSLTKIVFINSAHVKYAEVEIDGNVHFTGTQGVGKTSLLRALLFFYNCRKDKLGIRNQGQKTFDDFYIPTPASYIIYEVEREADEHPFSIILFRHHNRAAFRFVDAAFDKAWFVDNNGNVASDHLTVRQRIQSAGIDQSEIIERYMQYLDILYGNRSARVSKNLLKYYLLRSQQYQNLPKIIQNVFLNERVDAEFIKNTIINSLSNEDEEIAINLDFFRSKLSKFNDELRDISLWSEKNRQGIVESHLVAQKIIDTARNIKASAISRHEHCGMLAYAIGKAKRELPTISAGIDRISEAIEQTDNKLKDIQSKYDQENRKLTGELAIISNKIKVAGEKKKHYHQIGIENMLERESKLPGIKQQLKDLQDLYSSLCSSYRSVSDKYKILREQLENDKKNYLLSCDIRLNDQNSDLNNRERQRLLRQNKFEDDIRKSAETRMKSVNESLDSANKLLREQETQRAKAAVSSPLKESLDACEKSIAECDKDILELKDQKHKSERALDQIRNRLDSDCQLIESEYEAHIKDLGREMDRLKVSQKEYQHILDTLHGSFCEWLEANVPNWENTVGKIVDEKNILYSHDLNPRIDNSTSDSLYGIRVDVASIDKAILTPSKIKETISTTESEIKALSEQIIGSRSEKEAKIKELGKSARSQIKSIQETIDLLAQKTDLAKKKKSEEILQIESLKSKQKSMLDDIDAKFKERIDELQAEIDSLNKERENIETRRKKEIREIRNATAVERANDSAQAERLRSTIEADKAKYLLDCDERMKQLKKSETAELSAQGADTRMIDSTKHKIDDLEYAIAKIDAERDTIAIYRKDCEELFDPLPKFQKEKQRLEDTAAMLTIKFSERQKKLVLKKSEDSEKRDCLKSNLDSTGRSLKEAEDFTSTDVCPPEFKNAIAIATNENCSAIVSTIKDLSLDISHKSETLKRDINDFRRRFSSNNTFQLPTSFDSHEDYMRYADSLDEFVSNNKIRELQQLTSATYIDVLSRIASEFNMLLGRESEILKIINEINYDFQKKTFAGVIKSIRLRLDKSNTSIVNQLRNITDFWMANQYDLTGEINLFSSEGQQNVNKESIKYLKSLNDALIRHSDMDRLSLDQTFSLKFKIQENDNTTDWEENMKAIGSEGTDILVKAIINILLISVFKKRVSHTGDFRIHCMMDEIGRLADENIQGILNFANERGIYVVNSSPKAHRPLSYRRLYMLSKDADATTRIQTILSTRQAQLR